MSLVIRAARRGDAKAMARVLNEIIEIGGTTAHRGAFDGQAIVRDFIAAKFGICCFVAVKGPQLCGFQALEWCDPDWPGDDPLPADWAVIATYVNPRHHRRGVGRGLFEQTVAVAKAAGVRVIDATIRKENHGGQAFYGGIGFQDYRSGPETVSKRFVPS